MIPLCRSWKLDKAAIQTSLSGQLLCFIVRWMLDKHSHVRQALRRHWHEQGNCRRASTGLLLYSTSVHFGESHQDKGLFLTASTTLYHEFCQHVLLAQLWSGAMAPHSGRPHMPVIC